MTTKPEDVIPPAMICPDCGRKITTKELLEYEQRQIKIVTENLKAIGQWGPEDERDEEGK